VNALPTERDLPPGARDAARTRLVAAVAAPPVRRRWVPAAAAAAVLVVAGAAVGVAAVGGREQGRPGGAEPTPSATGAPAELTRAELLAVCQAQLDRYPGSPGPVRARALLRDRLGYVLAFGNARKDGYCTLGPRGEPGGVGTSTPAHPPETDPVVEVFSWASGELNGEASPPRSFVVYGLVGPQVTRVVVNWAGGRPVEAAVGDGMFVARWFGDPDATTGTAPTVVGYGPGGVELDRAG
jgi:hypothetical protein